MKLIIQPRSMIPIYQQIASQIETAILNGTLAEGEALPSVRQVARECAISALTVKKAYDHLEQTGFVRSVQGKGTYVRAVSREYQHEYHLHELEKELVPIIEQAKQTNIGLDTLIEHLKLLWEETT